MDARLLDYYNRELAYLRELGAEFADAFPKVATRLGMNGLDVMDPYVERLLEGFAFLAARIHLKIDAEFPRFSQRLLEVVYPQYLAPTPAMCVVHVPYPGEMSAAALAGLKVPRGTMMKSRPAGAQATRCTFVTKHDLTIWPVELERVYVGPPTADLTLPPPRDGKSVKGVIRLSFRSLGNGGVRQLQADELGFFLGGDERVASQLYELIAGHRVAVLQTQRHDGGWAVMSPSALRMEGFGVEQALLPTDSRVFQGYRLLHEYFAFPARFHFFTVTGLKRTFADLNGDTFELVLLLDRPVAHLAPGVDRSAFRMNCTPAVNLFPHHAGRVLVSMAEYEHHVVPDRTRPLDYEVYRVDAVRGFDRGNAPLTNFRPFYQVLDSDMRRAGAFFSTRRESRRLSEAAERNGARSSYYGSEVFLSLVDGAEAPWNEDVEQLAIECLLTNRDLPLLMPASGEQDFALDSSHELPHANIVRGPTRPRPSVAERDMTWRLISHLSLNYLALKELDEQNGAAALRELLALYAALADPLVARHGEAVRGVRVEARTRRLPGVGPLVYGRGAGIDVTVDERGFSGHSPYLFGCVLEQYLSRHVAINSFTELSLCGATTGHVATWPPRWGGRPDV